MKNRKACPPGRQWHWVLLVLFAGILVSSCKKVKPKAPQATAFDDTLAIGPSYLSAPVLFEVNELQEKVNRSLGKVLVDQERLPGKKGTSLRLRILRSGPVRLAFDGKKLNFGAPVTIWIDNPLDLRGKRHRLGSLDVEFSSPIAVTSEWRLQTNVRLNRYRWTRSPRIRILGLNVSVRKKVDKILQKRRTDIERSVDKAIYSELRLDEEVSKIWRTLHKPVRINRLYENIWLLPRPYSIQVSSVFGNTAQIVVPIRMQLQLLTHFGPQPDDKAVLPLPPLRRVKQIPLETNLNLLSRITYERLNDALRRSLHGRELQLAAQKIRIEDASVYGGGHTLILDTKVKGVVNGHLYFQGRPVFDTVSQVFSVRDFEYEIHSEEVLPSTADYFLHNVLKDSLQSALSIPLHKHLSELPLKIDAAFEKGKAGRKSDLSIQTFKFTPRQVAIRPEGVHIHINIKSNFNLKIKNI